ncbi:ECF transporter S component [Mycoplasma sp. P36-A1]|uniref:ECF transporter S component n=1 Tax=Mycoplasma sp. P36-A1 TaxID=3252900 RepID=UPI003C2CBF5A
MKTKDLTVGAFIIAIIAMMTFIPQLGFITIFGVASVTLIHIPVLISAITFDKITNSIIAGSAFGLCSLLNAFLRPTTITAPLFQNPLISVLPRIIFALFAYYLFRFLIKHTNKKTAAIATAIIAPLFHTVMVVGLMFVFGKSIFNTSFIALLSSIVLSNGIIELALAVLLVPTIGLALRKSLNQSRRLA